MSTLRDKLSHLERAIPSGDHPLLDSILRTVVLPQLRMIPEQDAAKVKDAVRNIINILRDVFDVDA